LPVTLKCGMLVKGAVLEIRASEAVLKKLLGNEILRRDDLNVIEERKDPSGRCQIAVQIDGDDSSLDQKLSRFQEVFTQIEEVFGEDAFEWQVMSLDAYRSNSQRNFPITERWKVIAVDGLSSQSSHEKTSLSEGEILLEAGWAFGNGAHPSTRGCVYALEWLHERDLVHGRKMLDVGTGTGILAIVAAKMGAACVWAVDVDTEAIVMARHNVRINGVQGRILVSDSRIALFQSMEIDTVLANLTPSVFTCLMPEMVPCLASSGFLVASGYRTDGSKNIKKMIRGHGFEPVWSKVVEGWETNIFRSMSTD